jgi:hypothetical protein
MAILRKSGFDTEGDTFVDINTPIGNPNLLGGTTARQQPGETDAQRMERINQVPYSSNTQYTPLLLSGGGGGIGAGFGSYNVPRINLDPFRQAQIAASRRLNDLKFQAVRHELEGTIAQTQLDRDFSISQLERMLRGQHEDISRDVLSRGMLRSGNFLEQAMEAETAAAEQKGHIIASTAAQVGALQSQIGLLGAQKAATIAAERAAIEMQYAMARAAG